MILLVSLINTAYVIFVGIGLAAVAYYFYRRWTRGRIVLFIFSKNRGFYRKTARPEGNILNVGGKAYLYKEDRVLLTNSFLLKEAVPCLLYAEGRVSPIDLFSKTPNDGITDSELSDIMNDGTIKDFVSAQGQVQPKQIRDLMLVMGLVLVVAIGGSAYVLLGKIAELAG